jgi:hypothetical protein
MDKVEQTIKSAGLEAFPPDILIGVVALLAFFVLWRMAMVKAKILVGAAVVVALVLAVWRGYLWMHS